MFIMCNGKESKMDKLLDELYQEIMESMLVFGGEDDTKKRMSKVLEEYLKEKEEQIKVLSDTVTMLSPLMMENKKLKEEVMEWKVKTINLQQERLFDLY